MSDRAAVVTTAIIQMIETAPLGELREAIESYLREEFEHVARAGALLDVADTPAVVPESAGAG